MIKAIIEIPKGSNYKYEIDKETGQLTLDRVIQMQYPSCYGFIPDTLAPDHDALDVFIISQHPIPPLTIVKANVYGIFICKDNGVEDNKVIATLDGDSTYGKNGFEVAKNHIHTFLNKYKKDFIVESYLSQKVAELIINKCSDEYALNQIRAENDLKAAISKRYVSKF